MVKRLLLLSLLVLVMCGAGATLSVAGPPVCGPAGCGPAVNVPPIVPGPPPICGPVQSTYSVVREQTTPVPAQLRRVRVVAPYLAGIAWPRTPLAFVGNSQTFPNPIAPGRYEWLVPASEFKNEHYETYVKGCRLGDSVPRCVDGRPDCGPGASCAVEKIPRCVYVKANYVRQPCGPAFGPGPVPMVAPPVMPGKVCK